MREPAVVPGAGALEAQCCHDLHHAVRRRDTGVAPSERTAVEAFAAALLELPQALLENGGCDSEGKRHVARHPRPTPPAQGWEGGGGYNAAAIGRW